MRDLLNKLRDPTNSGLACKILVLDAADAIESLARRQLAYWQAMPHSEHCNTRIVRPPSVTAAVCNCTIGRAIAELTEVIGE